MNGTLKTNHKLLVTIIKKGKASKIVKATKAVGAEGGTIVYGRGTGIHERNTFLGIAIEPEKEMVLTLVPECRVDIVLKAIEEAGKLNEPGTGIAFVIDAKKVGGIVHLLKQEQLQECKGDAHE